MENQENHFSKTMERYKTTISEALKRADKMNIEELQIEDKTINLISLIASSIAGTQAKALRINRGFREVVEVKEVFCFIAFLYFDYRTEFLANRFKCTRSSIHHYCKNVAAKYQCYKDYREKIHKFFAPEDMDEMIKKFELQKRDGKEKKTAEGQVA